MRKYFVLPILAMAMITFPVCALATDVEVSAFGNTGLDLSGFSLSSDIDSLASANGMDGFGEGLDLSLDGDVSMDTDAANEYFETVLGDSYTGISSNLSSVSMPDGIDFESLNTQYANLQMDFADNQKELSTDLELPSFDGYSGDVTKAFQETFGDMADSLKISSYSLPEDFDINGLLSKSIADRDSAISSIKESSTFQTVSNNLSYGAIFDEASKGVSMDSLNEKVESLGMNNVSSIMSDVSEIVSEKDASNKESFLDVKSDKNNQYNKNSSQLQGGYDSGTSGIVGSGNANEEIQKRADAHSDSLKDNRDTYDQFVQDNPLEKKTWTQKIRDYFD